VDGLEALNRNAPYFDLSARLLLRRSRETSLTRVLRSAITAHMKPSTGRPSLAVHLTFALGIVALVMLAAVARHPQQLRADQPVDTVVTISDVERVWCLSPEHRQDVAQAAAALDLVTAVKHETLVKALNNTGYVSLDRWSEIDAPRFTQACRAAIGALATADRPGGVPGTPLELNLGPEGALSDEERVWCLDPDHVEAVTNAAATLRLIDAVKNEALVRPLGSATYVSLSAWSRADQADFDRACKAARDASIEATIEGGRGLPPSLLPTLLTLAAGAGGYWFKKSVDDNDAEKGRRRAEAANLGNLGDAFQGDVKQYADSQAAGTGKREQRLAAENSMSLLKNEIRRLSMGRSSWQGLRTISEKLDSEPLTSLGEWPTAAADPDAALRKAQALKALADEIRRDVVNVQRALEGDRLAEQTIKSPVDAATMSGS
jgi:hypothetical protein